MRLRKPTPNLWTSVNWALALRVCLRHGACTVRPPLEARSRFKPGNPFTSCLLREGFPQHWFTNALLTART
ncbi:hypothetical protein SD81_033985 [Tolypothrix campylonemoides VB511288]|nr:hypothetical protein SD81_033985 [Tolypothrix campylonemoides VB511288]